MVGSTKNTVDAIRNGTYREAILEAKSPMDVGLCSYKDLERTLNRTRVKKENSYKFLDLLPDFLVLEFFSYVFFLP